MGVEEIRPRKNVPGKKLLSITFGAIIVLFLNLDHNIACHMHTQAEQIRMNTNE